MTLLESRVQWEGYPRIPWTVYLWIYWNLMIFIDFLVKNRWTCTSKISKIRYYSSSKRIFTFFEQRPQHFRFLAHLEAFPRHFWGILEASGGHFGRLEANLSQHRAILRPLGANLEASWDVLRDLAASKRTLDGPKRLRHSSTQPDHATAMPRRSHDSPTLGSKTALGEGIRGGERRINFFVLFV